MKVVKYLTLLIICVLFFSACSGHHGEPIIEKSRRTVLVYMVATNSLGLQDCDLNNVADMDKAMKTMGDDNDCRLLVYHVRYGEQTKLYEIVCKGGVVTHQVLRIYPDGLSITRERMQTVFADMLKFAPADSYGLVLWSHATGWIPKLEPPTTKSTLANKPLTRSFGKDNGQEMPLTELASALPNNLFDFIYSDTCFMGEIEVAYQLRNKTKFFVAIPSEEPSDGMPYQKNVPLFFTEVADVVGMAKNTYNYYMNQYGLKQSITISVVDCTKLGAIADFCRDLYSHTPEREDLSGLQGYIIPSENVCTAFDFGQYIRERCENDEQRSEFMSLLNQAVIYKAATPKLFNVLAIDPKKFSGLSTYVTSTCTELTNEQYYKTLDWYKVTH